VDQIHREEDAVEEEAQYKKAYEESLAAYQQFLKESADRLAFLQREADEGPSECFAEEFIDIGNSSQDPDEIEMLGLIRSAEAALADGLFSALPAIVDPQQSESIEGTSDTSPLWAHLCSDFLPAAACLRLDESCDEIDKNAGSSQEPEACSSCPAINCSTLGLEHEAGSDAQGEPPDHQRVSMVISSPANSNAQAISLEESEQTHAHRRDSLIDSMGGRQQPQAQSQPMRKSALQRCPVGQDEEAGPGRDAGLSTVDELVERIQREEAVFAAEMAYAERQCKALKREAAKHAERIARHLAEQQRRQAELQALHAQHAMRVIAAGWTLNHLEILLQQ
jgi:hypothetical protein